MSIIQISRDMLIKKNNDVFAQITSEILLKKEKIAKDTYSDAINSIDDFALNAIANEAMIDYEKAKLAYFMSDNFKNDVIGVAMLASAPTALATSILVTGIAFVGSSGLYIISKFF